MVKAVTTTDAKPTIKSACDNIDGIYDYPENRFFLMVKTSLCYPTLFKPTIMPHRICVHGFLVIVPWLPHEKGLEITDCRPDAIIFLTFTLEPQVIQLYKPADFPNF
jgi:hypothetical protein